MIYNTSFANRLGNRSNNQDRSLIVEKPERILLVVADGMGGHARGELAAQVAVNTIGQYFLQQRSSIHNPDAFLKTALEAAHLEIFNAGQQQAPPVDPRTTCVACLVQDHQAYWAHVGDSRLYLLRDGKIYTRTRDHTPVEQLFQSGEISESEILQHPLRNSVNSCLGGAGLPNDISFGRSELQTGDILLLCSDGLWSALPEQALLKLADGDLEQKANQLADQAEKTSYPHSDNVSLLSLKWLSEKIPADKVDATEVTPCKPSAAQKDPVQNAIDDINRAILDYASELKET